MFAIRNGSHPIFILLRKFEMPLPRIGKSRVECRRSLFGSAIQKIDCIGFDAQCAAREGPNVRHSSCSYARVDASADRKAAMAAITMQWPFSMTSSAEGFRASVAGIHYGQRAFAT